MDLHRDTDKISIAQYTALTFTGLFFSRYSLLVQPVNYALCSVNIALFGSSGWHLGRKINAVYISSARIVKLKVFVRNVTCMAVAMYKICSEICMTHVPQELEVQCCNVSVQY